MSRRALRDQLAERTPDRPTTDPWDETDPATPPTDIRSMRVRLLVACGTRGDTLRASGTLHLMAEGFGFLRHEAHGFQPGPDDIHVSPQQVRALGLRNGNRIRGTVRLPRPTERFLGMAHIESIDGDTIDAHFHRTPFAELLPVVPRHPLTSGTDTWSTRLDDLAPVCAGQRLLVRTAHPAWGGPWLANWAARLLANHQDVVVVMVALEAPPERVAMLQESIDQWPGRATLIAPPMGTNHNPGSVRPGADALAAATLAIDRGRRLLEAGKQVVLIVDGANALARTWAMAMPPTGRVLAPSFDVGAMQAVLDTFTAARSASTKGSLTVACTADTRRTQAVDCMIHDRLFDLAQVVVTLTQREDAARDAGEEEESAPAVSVDAQQTFTRPEADIRPLAARQRARETPP